MTKAEESYAVDAFELLNIFAHVSGKNPAVHYFKDNFLWPYCRLYVNHFYKVPRLDLAGMS